MNTKKINFFRIFWPIILFLLVLGQLQRIQLGQNLAIYLHDIVIFVWSIVFFLTKIKFKKLKKIIIQNKYFAAFLIWSIGSLLLRQLLTNFDIKPYLYFLRTINYLLFAYSLTQLKKLFPKKIKPVFFGVLVTGLTAIGIALIQYFLMPDGRHLHIYGWDQHYYRLMGLFLDPNFTGLIIVLTLLNLLRYKQVKKLKLYLPYLISVISLALTFSRSSYLVFLISSFILFLHNFSHKKIKTASFIAITVVIFLTSLPFIPKPGGEGVNLSRTSTIQSRMRANSSVMQQLQGFDWLVGLGLFNNRINEQLNTSHPIHAHFPDSLPVFILSGTGLIGLLLFMLSLIHWGRGLKNESIKLIMFIVLLIHSLFNLSLIEPFSLLFFLISIAA
ncbi:MAG: hypothetical protein U9O78_01250 [Patescibacteria group bacterium]|nr:hypothetical protein [Patescibacteria group bacterium]